MAKADIPFTDQSVSTSDPSGTLMTILMLIIGFGVFSMTRSIGDYVADEANDKVASVIGFDPSTGDDGPDVV